MKILALTDHPLCTSGVGVQARFLIEGLVKTGKYSFRVLGGAVKHEKYDTQMVNPDFIIKPVDGFGTRDMIRSLLITERPDALFIFTDPRQFIWMWEIEDEIKQVCPIVYWHVWDNDPYPSFNKVWYDSTEVINCLSWKTYELLKPHYPDKVNYIPHAFPKEIYFPLPAEQVKQLRSQNFGTNADHFIALWVNRNATRKMGSDVIASFSRFLDRLEKEEGHRKALLLMHTNPADQEGPNLFAVADLYKVSSNVLFSPNKIEFAEMNVLQNITDCCVNVSKAEGFGLQTLIALQVGKPILALKTGGMTRQVIDHRDGVELGVAIEPAERTLVGSQLVPFIHEDIVDKEAVVDGFMKLYRMSSAEKEALSVKARDYVDYEFSYDKMISEWDRTLETCVTDWKNKKPAQWELVALRGNKQDSQLPPRLDPDSANQPTNSNSATLADMVKPSKLSINQPKKKQ